jgi:hypothetical protein
MSGKHREKEGFGITESFLIVNSTPQDQQEELRAKPCPEGYITDPTNTRLEETSLGQRRMGAPFEGHQGPTRVVTSYMDG